MLELRCLSHGREVFYDNTRMLWVHKDGSPCREMNELGIMRDKIFDVFDPNISLSDIIRGKITTNFVCGAFKYLRDSWKNKKSDEEFQKKIARVLMCLILGQYVGERIEPRELESLEKYVASTQNMLLSLSTTVCKDTINQINAGLASSIGKIILINENSLRRAIQKIIYEKTNSIKSYIMDSMDRLQNVIHSHEFCSESILKDLLAELRSTKAKPEEKPKKQPIKVSVISTIPARMQLILELRRALEERRMRKGLLVRFKGLKAIMDNINKLANYAVNNTDIIFTKKMKDNNINVRVNSKINFATDVGMLKSAIIEAKLSSVDKKIGVIGGVGIKIRDLLVELLYHMGKVEEIFKDVPRINVKCVGDVEVNLDIDDDEIYDLLKISLFSTYVTYHLESISNYIMSYIRERFSKELHGTGIKKINMLPLFSEILEAYRTIDDDLFRVQLLVIAYIFLTGHYNLSEEDSNKLLSYIIYTDMILHEISKAFAMEILNVLFRLLLIDLLAGNLDVKAQGKVDPNILMFAELTYTCVLYEAVHNVLIESASKLRHISTINEIMDISSDLLLDLRQTIERIFDKYDIRDGRKDIENELDRLLSRISSKMSTLKSHLGRIYIVVSLQRIFRKRYPERQIEFLPIEKIQERKFKVHITMRVVVERPKIRSRAIGHAPETLEVITVAREKISLRKEEEKRKELNIPVVLEDVTLGVFPAYTDGKVIYINPLFVDHLLNEGYTEKQIREIIDGLIVHEKAHILYSDFIILNYLRVLINLIGESEYVLLREIFNIIEDFRIEFLVRIYRPLEAEKLFALSLLNREMSVPNIKESATVAISLAMDTIIFLLHGYIKSPEEIIDKIKDKKIRMFLSELFDIETVVMLFRGARGKRSRDALASATLLWARIITLLEKHFGEYKEQVDKYVDSLKPGLLALLQKNIEKIISRLFPFLPDEIKTQIIEILKRSKTLRSFLLAIREIVSKFLSSFEAGGRFGSYQRARKVIASRHDYEFYNDTTRIYAKTIQELKRKVERLKIQYREKPSRFGDIMEEHLPKVYVWSLTRDQPAPQTFTGYERVIPKLDILIHIDLSGSMADVAAFVLRAAIIILEAFKSLIEKDIIRLAIVSFGDTYAINKSLCESPRKVRIEERLYGGTVIFETLLGAINSMKSEWRKDSTKIIFIFTDTEDSLEDLENADAILNSIRTTLGQIRIIVLSTNKSPLSSLKKYVDRTIYLGTLNKLPKVLANQILRAITQKSLTRIY
mgnify:CR=1 FL=1